MRTQRSLGKALSIVARQKADEEMMHIDVDVMYAPGECHTLVARGAERRRRTALRLAKSVSGLTRGQFNRVLSHNWRYVEQAADNIIAREMPWA